MARQTQFHRIVAVLRAQRPDAEYRHILRLAALIIEAHREPDASDYDAPPSRSPFFALEVDTALRRAGGFSVLNFERKQGMTFDDERSDDQFRFEARLRGLIGRISWPRTETD
jgi:hypothetical protein